MNEEAQSRLEPELEVVAQTDEVEKLQVGLWRFTWRIRDGGFGVGQVQLFSFLLALAGELLLDVEETLDDSPVPLVPVRNIHGVGSLGLVRSPTEALPLLNWLGQQQWLALSWPVKRLHSGDKLDWRVHQFYRDPNELTKLIGRVGAFFALVSYYDNDSWLLAMDGT